MQWRWKRDRLKQQRNCNGQIFTGIAQLPTVEINKWRGIPQYHFVWLYWRLQIHGTVALNLLLVLYATWIPWRRTSLQRLLSEFWKKLWTFLRNQIVFSRQILLIQCLICQMQSFNSSFASWLRFASLLNRNQWKKVFSTDQTPWETWSKECFLRSCLYLP